MLNVSFANINGTTYETTKKRIYQVLVNLYEDKRFLIDEGCLVGTEADSFGFTEEEGFDAVDECGLGEHKEGVKIGMMVLCLENIRIFIIHG